MYRPHDGEEEWRGEESRRREERRREEKRREERRGEEKRRGGEEWRREERRREEKRREQNRTPQTANVIRPAFCSTQLLRHLLHWHGRSAVVESYSHLLRAGRSGDRIPVGVNFLHPSKAHPASYTRGTEPHPGVQRSGRGVNHTLPSSTEVKERTKLYISSPCTFMAGFTVIYFLK